MNLRESDGLSYLGRLWGLSDYQDFWVRVIFKLFLGLCLLLTLWGLWLIRSGFFKEQARMKSARVLIEQSGHLYKALEEDQVDPSLVLPWNAPTRPRWTGERVTENLYLLQLSYSYKGRRYLHRWKVDLQAGRVYRSEVE